MKDYINIALPKGRLGEKAYALLKNSGYECPAIEAPGRKLIFENPEKGVRYFWVKPSDVAIYVERGAADLGIVGKDILLEYAPDVYELLDLQMGKCRMALEVARNGFPLEGRISVREVKRTFRVFSLIREPKTKCLPVFPRSSVPFKQGFWLCSAS